MHGKPLVSTLKLVSMAVMASLSLGLTAPALASPVMDFRTEDLLSVADGLKDDLHLNPNQQTLWRQLEGKSRGIINEREKRQHLIQANMANGLNNPALDLRQLSAAIDAESALSDQDGRQLRELWLTMNDALDDQQRQTTRAFLADRLQRVDVASCDRSSAAPKDKSSGKGRGKGMGGGGMGGGMGGGGSAMGGGL
ncbi:basic type II keratin [Collimonas sp. PA-H2]|uniref:hypothetical protein n=1 Tax=Collimonas sp. PA-H2 TaxID=1881062 RepID=UPI000BF87A3E|nr:hypothetical protein [Collimonas sp. PA-H2]PFH11424.1 basic type II keratin [Collimonas sp. PA-H2]